jgi:anti-sigma factor RsiW
MKRHLRDDELVALAFAELSGRKETDCRQHLASCKRCRTDLNTLEQAIAALERESLQSPPPFAWYRLRARIAKSGIARDWQEPKWLPVILGHAGGVLLIIAIVLVLGNWLETAPVWEYLRLWSFARSFGPHGLVALAIFSAGTLLTLAMTPVFWWESQQTPQHLHDGIH